VNDEQFNERLEAIAKWRDHLADQRRQLGNETRVIVREARKREMAPTEIARRLHLSRQAVYDYLNA
jgi:DNA invertase Pin-like site-specific DNA recombinase